MAFSFETTLAQMKERQWALAEFDWNAPGAECVSDEQRAKLKPFMADLVWIENIGARGFAALARKAPNETLAEIYKYFHAEEQRHANAELALMRRWGMLEDGEVPEPNIDIRLAIKWLDEYSDEMPLSALGALIPMLEVALDGALLNHLLTEVKDPLCHEVFRKINADEARHLSVDFHVLDLIGTNPVLRQIVEGLGAISKPSTVLGLMMYVGLINRMRNNVVDMGLSPDKLLRAISRYGSMGDRNPHSKRVPTFHLFKLQGQLVGTQNRWYTAFAEVCQRLTFRVPSAWAGPLASWSKELTFEPVAT